MRLKDIKKAGVYLCRIIKDPFSRQSMFALKRYIGYGIVLIVEKIRGLDFTMVYQCENNEHNNNYSKSPRKVLKRIFDEVDFTQKHSILDIGCGKGYVMKEATKYPFEKIGGVEYTAELSDICQNNIDILGLENVKVYNCDAKAWEGYSNYDIFYFGNPFDETIVSVVADKIMRTHKNSKCYIYYLNPSQKERQMAIMNAGFKLVKVLEDENEMYFNVNVYEN